MMARWERDGNDAATLAIFDGFGSLGVSEVSGFAAERQIFGTFFGIFSDASHTRKPRNLGIPTFRGFLFPCERGELNPHEHTLTAT